MTNWAKGHYKRVEHQFFSPPLWCSGFVVNSEPHTGEGPSLPVCVGQFMWRHHGIGVHNFTWRWTQKKYFKSKNESEEVFAAAPAAVRLMAASWRASESKSALATSARAPWCGSLSAPPVCRRAPEAPRCAGPFRVFGNFDFHEKALNRGPFSQISLKKKEKILAMCESEAGATTCFDCFRACKSCVVDMIALPLACVVQISLI